MCRSEKDQKEMSPPAAAANTDVHELSGHALDRAVAEAIGHTLYPTPKNQDPESVWHHEDTGHWAEQLMPYAPSRRWDLAGPLIERYRINIHFYTNSPDCSAWTWKAEMKAGGSFIQQVSGRTALEAAMRALVKALREEKKP
jgi:hypothetical protein